MPGGNKVGRGEGGLTIVEVMVALSIVMLAAAALAVVLTNGVLAVTLSQQSQTASNLAASIVAEAESLPWSTLEDGLYSSDPTLVADESSGGNVGVAVNPSGDYCYEGMPLFVSSGGESLLASATTAPECPSAGQGSAEWPWQDTSWATGTCYPSLSAELTALSAETPPPPLDPHAVCVTLNHTNFTIAVYPTVALSSPYPPTEVEVSVVVTWHGNTSSATGETRVTNTVVITQCRVEGEPPSTGTTLPCPQ